MIKVALINPGKNLEFATAEPLNLEYIASYLEKNNVEVKIIDELAGQNVKKEIRKFSPDFVGITATTPIAPDAYRIADFCREEGIKTILGGIHPSALPQEALKHSDLVVIGEGEKAMLDIVKGKIKSGAISYPYIENLDEIPFPARHLVDMEFYLTITNNAFLHHTPPDTKTAGLITSRGCPFSCIFCHNSLRKSPFRFHSAERVVSEIENLIYQYGVEALFFFDDHLFAVKSRLKKICELMIKKGLEITWGCNSRVDAVDLESLKIAYKAGCREISFGFESGSQRILDVLNKKTTVEQNKRAIELCKKIGIMVDCSFMIGSPTETVEDVKLTQKFIKENPIDFAGICITTPFPGTKLWEQCKEKNLLPKEIDWTKFDLTKFSNPIIYTDIPLSELKSLFEETDKLVAGKKRKIKISWLIKSFFKAPIKTMKIFRRTSLIKYLKRLEVR